MVNDLLGDRVAKAMERLGVAFLVRRFFPGCDCEANRKWLNRLHRFCLCATQTEYLAVSRDHPGQYAAWCNLHKTVFMTKDKERACHFETREGCDAWCKGDGAGTPIFRSQFIILI